VGARVSEGCLRATDRNMRWLMRTVPVGTQVHDPAMSSSVLIT
jgi:lipoprotein-anchoring transpeptidase ErfK/SrfK